MAWPAAEIVVGEADLSTEIDGVWLIGSVLGSVSVTTVAPPGEVPVAVAVLLIAPALTSASVTTYDAEHVVNAAGAKLETGHVTANKPGKGSLTSTALKVTFPVFVTRNE